MDRPLLALTRPPVRARQGLSPETTAAKNMRQLVQLRWIAVAGQLVAVLAAQYGLGIALPFLPMVATIAALALANVAIIVALPRHRGTDWELFGALLLDVAALSLLLYLSGGATNPFVALYLLQVVLGAILLPPAFAWLLVAATTLAHGILSVTHRPLALPAAWREELDLGGDWAAFAMIAVLLVLFIGRITRNLRARDAYVADLARQAAEEDAIVRMGLFASSAAHELGTPLATLSVILSDWQRHPALRKHVELLREIADMRGEVQRCTDLVGDILNSVGGARGGAMTRQRVDDLVQGIAADWRDANPQARLSVAKGDARGALIAAEPALRHALWGLLDNAAFVSPAFIELAAETMGDRVALCVRDRGPGFADGMLEAVGTPYRSTKGEGHGLGLFLAATVARRLDGTLSAANRDGGGAEVRLVLPVAGKDRDG